MLKPCSEPRCPELVTAGRCQAHTKLKEQRRGSAASRGYDSHWSRVFRPLFIQMLIAAGVAPVCGAALPGGPSMAYSRCKAEGRLNAQRLHLDHDPPLRADERGDRRKVEDPLRVGFLCEADHARKTQAEQQAGLG